MSKGKPVLSKAQERALLRLPCDSNIAFRAWGHGIQCRTFHRVFEGFGLVEKVKEYVNIDIPERATSSKWHEAVLDWYQLADLGREAQRTLKLKGDAK